MDLDLKGKVVTIVGDQFVADKIHFRNIYNQPKSVDYVVYTYADLTSVNENLEDYLRTHMDIDVLMIFPFLWEMIYMEWDEELEIGSIHLREQQQFNIKNLISQVGIITNKCIYKYPNLSVLWLLPYTPNFYRFNKNALVSDFWQEQCVARSFYSRIKDLSKALYSTIPEAMILDLHECYFLSDNACERTFHSEYKDALQFPSICTGDGLTPTEEFVARFLKVFQQKIFPGIRQKFEQRNALMISSQNNYHHNVGSQFAKPVHQYDYQHSTNLSSGKRNSFDYQHFTTNLNNRSVINYDHLSNPNAKSQPNNNSLMNSQSQSQYPSHLTSNLQYDHYPQNRNTDLTECGSSNQHQKSAISQLIQDVRSTLNQEMQYNIPQNHNTDLTEYGSSNQPEKSSISQFIQNVRSTINQDMQFNIADEHNYQPSKCEEERFNMQSSKLSYDSSADFPNWTEEKIKSTGTNKSPSPNIPDIAPNLLNSIKDALNFLNFNKTQETKKISIYEGYLRNFFHPMDWRNLFLKGDENVALDCLEFCVKSLEKITYKKGLKIIMITSSNSFIRLAEKAMKDLIESKFIGFNDCITYGKPLVLVDTPTNIRLRLVQTQFNNLSDVCALLAFGDELLLSATSLGIEFTYLVKGILSERKKDDLNKVIISESGSSEKEILAKTVFCTTFLVPNREEEKQKKSESKPSLTDFLSGLSKETTGDSLSSSSRKAPSPPAMASLRNWTSTDSQSVKSLSKKGQSSPFPALSGDRDCRLEALLHSEKASHLQFIDNSRESHKSLSKEREALSRNSRSQSPAQKEARKQNLSYKGEIPKNKAPIKLEDIFKHARIEVSREKKQECEEHNKIFLKYLSCMPYSVRDSYLVERKQAIDDHESDYRTYKEVPDLHPVYEEKYGLFINFFEDAYGKDCNPRHTHSTWKRFWDYTITSLKEAEWLEKEMDLQKVFMKKYGSNSEKTSAKEKDKNIIEKNNADVKEVETLDSSIKNREFKMQSTDNVQSKGDQINSKGMKADKHLKVVGEKDTKLSESETVRKKTDSNAKKMDGTLMDDDEIMIISSDIKNNSKKRECPSMAVSVKRTKTDVDAKTELAVSGDKPKSSNNNKELERDKSAAAEPAKDKLDLRNLIEMRRKLIMEGDSPPPNEKYDPFEELVTRKGSVGKTVKESTHLTGREISSISKKEVKSVSSFEEKSHSNENRYDPIKEKNRSTTETNKLNTEKGSYAANNDNKILLHKRNSNLTSHQLSSSAKEQPQSNEAKSLSEELDMLMSQSSRFLKEGDKPPRQENKATLSKNSNSDLNTSGNKRPFSSKKQPSSSGIKSISEELSALLGQSDGLTNEEIRSIIKKDNAPSISKRRPQYIDSIKASDNYSSFKEDSKLSLASKPLSKGNGHQSREDKNTISVKGGKSWREEISRLADKESKSELPKMSKSFIRDKNQTVEQSKEGRRLSLPTKEGKKATSLSSKNDNKSSKGDRYASYSLSSSRGSKHHESDLKRDKLPVVSSIAKEQSGSKVSNNSARYQAQSSRSFSRKESEISSARDKTGMDIPSRALHKSSTVKDDKLSNHKGLLPFDKYLEIIQSVSQSPNKVATNAPGKSKTVFPIPMESSKAASKNTSAEEDFMKIYLDSCSAVSKGTKKDAATSNLVKDFSTLPVISRPSSNRNKSHDLKEAQKPSLVSNLNKPKIQFSLFEALNSLESICPKIGVMGPALKSIIISSRGRLPNIYEAYKLFSDSDSELLVSIAINKLKSLLPSCSRADKDVFQKTIMLGQKLLDEAKKSRKNGPPPSTEFSQESKGWSKSDSRVDIEAIARATVGQTTEETCQFIKNTFMYKGLSEPSKNELDHVFEQVSKLHFQFALKL